METENKKEISSNLPVMRSYVFREVVRGKVRYYEIGEHDKPRTHLDLWCDRRVCEGFWGDREMAVKVVALLNNYA